METKVLITMIWQTVPGEVDMIETVEVGEVTDCDLINLIRRLGRPIEGHSTAIVEDKIQT